MTAGAAGTAPRLVLASASPARLATLRAAGIEPEVVVSGIDERAVDDADATRLALLLAQRKCAAVARLIGPRVRADSGPVIVVGCDSVLELDGRAYGKPLGVDEAERRWRAMRGRAGVLHTGHSLQRVAGGSQREVSGVASTVVRFAAVDDDEIEAYVATGEPLLVAGGFTLDGLGSPYVRGIDGDPHTVVGIGLPLLRELVGELGVRWHDLWNRPPSGQPLR